MSEIMIALASQLSTYLNAAEQTAERRYKELREDIIKEFARSDSSARAEAFSDPDYQFVLRDAHETYARSGQAELRDELVRLLIERSKQPSGSRSALILNDAIRVSKSLTYEELSILAVVFMIKYVTVTAFNLDAVASRYEFMLAPFVDNLTEEVFSFEYLESLGCMTIERVASHYPIDEHMHRLYNEMAPGLSQEDIWSNLTDKSRSLRVLGSLWPKAFFQHSMLTALGKALAHSALESKKVMDAPLSIWVR